MTNQNLTPDQLDERLIDLFCKRFGEHHRQSLSFETDMDSIDGWDSMNFIDLVYDIEEEYGVVFSAIESSQMFQLGHIQRLIRSAVASRPHDDVLHAYAQLSMICGECRTKSKIVVLSGSSTREGFLPLSKMQELISVGLGGKWHFFNISVSGLVAAEILQLVETLVETESTYLVVGFSSILLFGCGSAEFRRSVNKERFELDAPEMHKMLKSRGYHATTTDKLKCKTIDACVAMYFGGHDPGLTWYNPYQYPTLKPWDPEKFKNHASILQFYNQAPLNYMQSGQINSEIIKKICEICNEHSVDLMFLELTLHGETRKFMEQLDDLETKSKAFIHDLCQTYGVRFFEAMSIAGITDADFRDPAHLVSKKEDYSLALIEGLKEELD